MKLREKTILITGGAGFIGSHVSEVLAQKNKVIIFDNFTSAVVSPKNLHSLKNVRVVRGYP